MKKIFIVLAGVLIAQAVSASMTTGVMNGLERYAWSEKLGRLDMAAVVVEDAGLSGYAMAGSDRIDFKTADFQVKMMVLGAYRVQLEVRLTEFLIFPESRLPWMELFRGWLMVG